MKKLLTSLCLSSVLLAAPAAQAQWECNWLVGISGGWMETSGNLHLNAYNSTNNTNISTVSQGISHSGWDWGVLGGYQMRCNGWLMGLELNVDWMSNGGNTAFQFTDSESSSWSGTGDYKRETNVGLTARLGMQVSPCFLPYVRAGLETSRDKVSFDAAFVNVAGTETHYANISGSRRSWRGVFGIGAEVPIPMVCGLSLRAEYDYHTNGRTVSAYGVADNNTTVVSASTKQHMNSVIAALVWNFL